MGRCETGGEHVATGQQLFIVMVVFVVVPVFCDVG